MQLRGIQDGAALGSGIRRQSVERVMMIEVWIIVLVACRSAVGCKEENGLYAT